MDTSEFTVECDMKIEGAGGENGVMQGADVTRNTVTNNMSMI